MGSTQQYLKELIKNNEASAPFAVVADLQTAGVGSRGNSWSGVKDNLFLSFAIPPEKLSSCEWTLPPAAHLFVKR